MDFPERTQQFYGHGDPAREAVARKYSSSSFCEESHSSTPGAEVGESDCEGKKDSPSRLNHDSTPWTLSRIEQCTAKNFQGHSKTIVNGNDFKGRNWWEWLCRTLSIIFRLVVVVVVSRRRPGGGARVRIAENNLCYKAAFFF